MNPLINPFPTIRQAMEGSTNTDKPKTDPPKPANDKAKKKKSRLQRMYKDTPGTDEPNIGGD